MVGIDLIISGLLSRGCNSVVVNAQAAIRVGYPRSVNCDAALGVPRRRLLHHHHAMVYRSMMYQDGIHQSHPAAAGRSTVTRIGSEDWRDRGRRISLPREPAEERARERGPRRRERVWRKRERTRE
eukprot:488936-Rhodomonas_salina.4